MSCQYCDSIEKGEILFENESGAVIIPGKPATEGHVVIIPKRHITIIEQLEDYEMAQLTLLANKASIMVFEKFGAQGTNILVQNGISAGQLVPHVAMHVLPRRENDGISLQWDPKQIGGEDLDNIENILKEECKSIGQFSLEPKKIEPKEEVMKRPPIMSGEENYMIKALRRIP